MLLYGAHPSMLSFRSMHALMLYFHVHDDVAGVNFLFSEKIPSRIG